MKRKLGCVWDQWEEIEAALDAFAGTPEDIRELGLDELTELARFQDEMECVAKWLKNNLNAAAAGEVFKRKRGRRIIASVNHPVLEKLRERARGFRELATKIVHANRSIN